MAKEETFSELSLKEWRQFDAVDIVLHPSLTVITGANGSGKSTILRIFSRYFGFDRPYLSTPVTSKETGILKYLSGLFFSVFRGAQPKTNEPQPVGRLTYSDGQFVELSVPNEPGVEYALNFKGNSPSVAGTHINSHQAVSNYRQIGQIPMTPITADVAFTNYIGEVTNRYRGEGGTPPTYRLKEALISMALLGPGNEYVPGRPGVLRTFTTFVEVLRSILPETVGFLDLAIRPPEVVLVTRSGEFLIDAASGGVATLIDIAWRLHTFSERHKRFVVTLDEPENHLHPSMQRSLMGRLIQTFPGVQFIVATHSPFIVSSVRDANVYVLRYRQDEGREIEGFVPEAAKSRVVSERLSWVNKAGSANDILREVLGVPATMPEWAEESLEGIVEAFRGQAITEQSLGKLRETLAANGFEDYYADALSALVRPANDLPA